MFTFKGFKSKLKILSGFLLWIPWHSYEWERNCNQKEGNAQNTHKYPSDLPGLYYIHSKTRTLCCFPDSLQFKDYCVEPHKATSDHTGGPSEPHVSQHKNDSACDLKLNIYNAPARLDITDRHHSTSQINFLSFISQKTLRQHKLPDPCHHLICPTTLRSEARTCQLLIAAEEKTSNPTPKMFTQLLPVYPPCLFFPFSLFPLSSKTCIRSPLLTVAGFLLKLLLPRILHPDHFPPSLINEAPHILIDPPPSFSKPLPEHKHPSIPCKQNLPLH